MIGYGELFKIFVIIVVIFLVILMGIYLFRKARDALTLEDRRDKEYRRREKELERKRKHKKSMQDRQNMKELAQQGLKSFDNGVQTIGKDLVHEAGRTIRTVGK